MQDGEPTNDQLPVVIEANGLNATRGLLAAWPVVLVVGAIASLLAGSLFPIAIALVVFAALGMFAWPRLQLQFIWGRPTLRLRSDELELGEEAGFIFEQTSRRPVDVSSASLLTELVCTERIEWVEGHGDNRKTRSQEEVVVREQQVRSVEPTRTGLRCVGGFTVPSVAGAPTLDLSNHRITWRLTARLGGSRLPEGTETFEVTVLAKYAAAPLQDSVGS